MNNEFYKQITLGFFSKVIQNFELQVYDITVKNGKVLKTKTKLISYTQRIIPLLFDGYNENSFTLKDLANCLSLKDGRYYLHVLFCYDREMNYWDIKESKSTIFEETLIDNEKLPFE